MVSMQKTIDIVGGQRRAWWIVFGIISVVLAGGGFGTVYWIYTTLKAQVEVKTSPAYVNYDISGDYQKSADWAAAQAGYQAYVAKYPQPQNVKVLKGWSTAQIYGYMVSQVSGGLKVSCQYCHNVQNFSDDSNPKKVTARAMMLMSADLNTNYVGKLPASVGGYQVTCATCHNGQPVLTKGTYPVSIQNGIPVSFRLPLDRNYPGGLVVTGAQDATGKETRSVSDVTLNQYAMYHFNVSLGQGCTFCHNARYFPSYEVQQKSHAITMLQMTKHINETYSKQIMAGKTPSCWMCHQANSVPPGAANPGVVPAVLGGTGK